MKVKVKARDIGGKVVVRRRVLIKMQVAEMRRERRVANCILHSVHLKSLWKRY